jgi:diphosphoinositol-polyphosphate diphosphatase
MILPFEHSLWMFAAGFLVVAAVGSVVSRARAIQRRVTKRPLAIGPGVAQGCTIPYRIDGDELQVCLISLSNQSGWGFPKGTVDAPETVSQAALRESFEEAGVRGVIIGDALGQYSYVKRDIRLDVTVFLMLVTKVEKRWPERRVRERRFCSASEARTLLATADQRKLLDFAVAQITKHLTAAARGK